MTKHCALIHAVGGEEACPEHTCAFWEHGGAVVESGCAIERLGVDLSNRDLAQYLLDLRRAVESAQEDERDDATARRGLAELVDDAE